MATGPQGVQGIQGQQGEQGIRGMTGAQGVQGPHGGPTGPTGPQGTNGTIGVDGVTGPTGPGGGGASGGPDTAPAVPNAADDEFTVGTTLDTAGTRRSGATSWTSALSNGVATVDRGRLRISAPSNATYEFVWQPVSGSDWQYTASIDQTILNTDTSYLGMAVADASNNRFALLKSYTTGPRLQYLNGSTLTTAVSTPDEYTFYGPGYMQIEYRTLSNTTTLIGRYSTTGYGFTDIRAQSVAWTPSRIGYMIGTTNTVPGLTHELVSDWFRRDTSYTPTNVAGAVITTTGTVTSNATGQGVVYSFLSSGSFNVAFRSVTADVLLVGGGGGGGGNWAAGGGGGGGVVYATGVTIDPGPQAVTVGAGAAGGLTRAQAPNGSNSTFLSYTALGGGGGGTNNTAGLNGGCGGGAGFGSGTAGIGSQGGNGAPTQDGPAGGGGGGAGATATTKNGGVGIINSITGSNVYYAGGGGAGSDVTGGNGGLGGGGPGVSVYQQVAASNAGTANTGGGGGGGPGGTTSSGAPGGSGIVIIRVTG